MFVNLVIGMLRDFCNVRRLCAFDPHELFIQIDSTAREYMVECKSRLARLCPSPTIIDSPTSAMANELSASVNVERVGQFVASLLDEYDALDRVCRKIHAAVEYLVSTPYQRIA